jgi:hypothetical protein
VIPSACASLAPATLQGAVSRLSTRQDEAKLLAGGHRLLPVLKRCVAAAVAAEHADDEVDPLSTCRLRGKIVRLWRRSTQGALLRALTRARGGTS